MRSDKRTDGRTDRRTDMTELIVVIRDSVNAPNNTESYIPTNALLYTIKY